MMHECVQRSFGGHGEPQLSARPTIQHNLAEHTRTAAAARRPQQPLRACSAGPRRQMRELDRNLAADFPALASLEGRAERADDVARQAAAVLCQVRRNLPVVENLADHQLPVALSPDRRVQPQPRPVAGVLQREGSALLQPRRQRAQQRAVKHRV